MHPLGEAGGAEKELLVEVDGLQTELVQPVDGLGAGSLCGVMQVEAVGGAEVACTCCQLPPELGALGVAGEVEHAAEELGAVDVEVFEGRVAVAVAVVAEAGGEFLDMPGRLGVFEVEAGQDGELAAGPRNQGGFLSAGERGLAGESAQAVGLVERAAGTQGVTGLGKDLFDSVGGTGSVEFCSAHGVSPSCPSRCHRR
ncbi:hypothetical protein [Streptomyces althioticus]|uniref:hypothetical protein n=1 Tax=Streptomyces althioticus TaxID=83380 RepID=UPI00331DE2F2